MFSPKTTFFVLLLTLVATNALDRARGWLDALDADDVEDVEDDDDRWGEEQAAKTAALLQVENGKTQAAKLLGGLSLHGLLGRGNTDVLCRKNQNKLSCNQEGVNPQCLQKGVTYQMGRSCTGGSQAVHNSDLRAVPEEENVCKDEHMCMHTLLAGIKDGTSRKCRKLLRRSRFADGQKIKSLQTAWVECCKKPIGGRASFGQGVYLEKPLSGIAKRPFCSLYTDEGAYDPNTKCTPRCGKGEDECPNAYAARGGVEGKRDDDFCACRQEFANTQCSAGSKCGGETTGDAPEIHWRKCCNNNPRRRAKNQKFKSVGANANHGDWKSCPRKGSAGLWGKSLYCPGTYAEVSAGEEPSGRCDCAKEDPPTC